MVKTDDNGLPGAYEQYHCYLLRLTQETSTSLYRIILRDVQTRELRHFDDLEHLFAFLEALIASEESVG